MGYCWRCRPAAPSDPSQAPSRIRRVCDYWPPWLSRYRIHDRHALDRSRHHVRGRSKRRHLRHHDGDAPARRVVCAGPLSDLLRFQRCPEVGTSRQSGDAEAPPKSPLVFRRRGALCYPGKEQPCAERSPIWRLTPTAGGTSARRAEGNGRQSGSARRKGPLPTVALQLSRNGQVGSTSRQSALISEAVCGPAQSDFAACPHSAPCGVCSPHA